MTSMGSGGAGTKRKFPLFSSDWGTEMVTVKVGEGDLEHPFLLHKNIFCQASPYFDGAFNGKFVESAGTATLKHHHPFAFEVLYQWLYIDRVLRNEELRKTNEEMEDMLKDEKGQALLWTRVFKLGDQIMVRELKEEAYLRITDTVSQGLIPDAPLVAEVFDPAAPQPLLQMVFVGAAAWQVVFGDIGKPKEREEGWKEHPEYSLMVLKQVMVLSEKRDIGKRSSQCLHPARAFKYHSLSVAEHALRIDAEGGQ